MNATRGEVSTVCIDAELSGTLKLVLEGSEYNVTIVSTCNNKTYVSFELPCSIESGIYDAVITQQSNPVHEFELSVR